MVGYDNRKVAQNRKGVKRDFGLPGSTLFQAQGRKEPQHIGGPLGPVKVKEACQSPHLAKIQEIKSISKPPLPIQLYTICQNVSLDNFRKCSFAGNPHGQIGTKIEPPS